MWYFNSRQRNKLLRNHLSPIKSDENSAIQARLIFEAQVAFLVDCKDLRIEELIHKGGRIQQKMNESRKKVENEILKKWFERYSVIGWDVVNNSNEDNLGKLKEMLENRKSFADEVEVILIKRHKEIYDRLDGLTNHFSDNAIVPHNLIAELILDLCRGNRQWQFLCENECLKINGDYPIETPPEVTQPCPLGEERENEKKIPLQDVLEEVSTLVVHHNPEWFENHREAFKRMSDRMFNMEYDESKFRERFYQAISDRQIRKR